MYHFLENKDGIRYGLDLDDNKKIFGRDKAVGEILNYLKKSKYKTVVIYGRAGSGKRSVATLCARQWINKGVIKNVVFFKCNDKTEFKKQWSEFLKEANVSGSIKDINRNLFGDTLIIFDNVKSYSFVKKFAEPVEGVFYLMTSAVLDKELPTYALGSLDGSSSADIVKSLMPPSLWDKLQNQTDDLLALLKITCYVPSMIIFITENIIYTNWSIETLYTYADCLKNTLKQLLNAEKNKYLIEKGKNYSDKVFNILLSMSLLDNNKIKVKWLETFPDITRHELDDILSFLSQSHLCQLVGEEQEQYINMDEVIQSKCKEICMDEIKEENRRNHILTFTLKLMLEYQQNQLSFLLPYITVEAFYKACSLCPNLFSPQMKNPTVYHYGALLGLWQIFPNITICESSNQVITLEELYEREKSGPVSKNEFAIDRKEGNSLVEIAYFEGHKECVEKLVSWGGDDPRTSDTNPGIYVSDSTMKIFTQRLVT